MSKISERFSQAISEKNINNAFLSKKYNISRQLVNKFFTTQKTITDKFAEICDGENINMNWLLTGKGQMFLKNENSQINIKNISNQNGDHNLAINGNNNNNIILDDNTNTLNINARIKDTGKTTRENEPMAFEFYLKEVCDLLKEYGSFNLVWELRKKLLAIKALHEQQS